MAIDLREILNGVTLQASAPGRIDCGGGWDLKGFAITHEAIHPSTVNLALNLRTTVTLDPAETGSVCVTGNRLDSQTHRHPLPFVGPGGLIFAIVSHFDVSGVRMIIGSDIPLQSGLGGSGVLAVALIAALSKALSLYDGRPVLTEHDVAVLAHHIEDGLHISHTGLQDQLAAAYGGVNQWVWCYSDFDSPFRRNILLPSARLEELRGRILVAYSGATHDSKTLISQWVQSFRDRETRPSWYGIHHATHRLADAMHGGRWSEAADALREEAGYWDVVCPDVWTPLTSQLRKAAEERGCGARFTGAGGGGCIWALGAPDEIEALQPAWGRILQETHSGRLLAGEVADSGLAVHAGIR